MQNVIPIATEAEMMLPAAPQRGMQYRSLMSARAQAAEVFGLHHTPANLPDRAPSIPAQSEELPFRLIALSEIKVSFGVMQGDILDSAQDLVIGDGFSFGQVSNLIPADSRLVDGKLRVTLSEMTDLGPASLEVCGQLDLILMSSDADVVRCQHLRCQTVDRQSQDFLLMPADFDTAKAYELIELGG